jgi:hypothetical protein
MMIRLVTAAVVVASVLAAVVGLIGWAVTTYAPLWVQIVSIPVVAWLLCLAVVALVERGTFDKWA